MTNKHNPWAELLQKYRLGTLSQKEQQQLDEHVSASPLAAQQVAEVHDPLLMFKQYPELFELDVEKSWQSFEKKLSET